MANFVSPFAEGVTFDPHDTKVHLLQRVIKSSSDKHSTFYNFYKVSVCIKVNFHMLIFVVLLLGYLEFRVGKTGSLQPWSRFIVYCSKLSFCQNDFPIGGIILAKGQLATTHYDSAPRPQRSCFANPNIKICFMQKFFEILLTIYLVCTYLSSFESYS